MKRKMTPRQEATARKAMAEAVAAIGSQRKLSKALNVDPGTVQYMATIKGYALPQYVKDIAVVTGVAKHRLRPDIYDETDAA